MSQSSGTNVNDVALGILVVLCGTMLLLIPALTTVKLALLLGWVMFAAGLLATIKGFRGRRKHVSNIVAGVITAIVGLYLVLNPLLAAKTLILLVILVAFVRGLVGLFDAFENKKDRAILFTVSAIDLAFAFVLLRVDAITAARLVGIYIALTIILWGFSLVVARQSEDDVATV